MQRDDRFHRNFAIATIGLASIHLVLELLYTFRFGQHFLGLLPDLVADALLFWGSLLILQGRDARGILCGAWGFTLCLHYRAFAWRFEEYLAGTSDGLIDATMYVLASTMAISVVCFGLTLRMCLPASGAAGSSRA